MIRCLLVLTLVCFYLTRLPDSFTCVVYSCLCLIVAPGVALFLVESPARLMPESLWNQRQTLAIRPIHALSQRNAASP